MPFQRCCRATDATKRITVGAPVLRDSTLQWVEFADLPWDSDDFPALGRAFAAEGGETRVPLGLGVVIACDMRAIVDFGVVWIDASRHT